ncbi:acyltransferase [Pseudoalteromonas sp. SR43-7]|uniref:acyltransferase n=1 Tax=Pseudoalteromonas sp. SR43-7 TaxID=2760939 RepID=UPI0015FC1533|nr:acyltransferase [Pseudoalteromonas sp. SR43-7]MBB1328169.1 acyltransferase [Pseudoalteromonas sp. SR43-7]
MKHKLFLLYAWFIWAFTFFLPDIGVLMRFRGGLYSLAMGECGKNFQVSSGARLFCLPNLTCGNDVYIATNVVINACEKIILGNEVMVGIGSTLVSGNHTLLEKSYRYGESEREEIFIGAGAWIAGNALVLAGGRLPESSLLAGGAVLSKSFYEPGIYGGIPAKLIKLNGK